MPVLFWLLANCSTETEIFQSKAATESLGTCSWNVVLCCLKYIFIKEHKEIRLGGECCVHLGRGRDKWRALVNTVMNLRVLCNVGNSWLAEELFASETGLFCLLLLSLELEFTWQKCGAFFLYTREREYILNSILFRNKTSIFFH